MPIGTNLLINAPLTREGRALVTAARDAAARTGDMQREERDRRLQDEHKTAHDQTDRNRQSQIEAEEADRKRAQGLTIDTAKLTDIKVSDSTKENEHIYKVWQDKSQTLQIGTGYESLSANGNNYANIVQTMDSKVLLIVTQDRQTDAYNFNTQSSKTYGLIVVNQNWR
jgi:hypothetical protein